MQPPSIWKNYSPHIDQDSARRIIIQQAVVDTILGGSESYQDFHVDISLKNSAGIIAHDHIIPLRDCQRRSESQSCLHPDLLAVLDRAFNKKVTTRNWKTIERCYQAMQAGVDV